MHATCGGMVYNRSLHQLTSEIRPGATPRTNFSALAATRRTVAARDRIVAKPVRGVAASSVASHACTDGDCERGREGGREPEGYPRVNFKSLCGAPGGGIA